MYNNMKTLYGTNRGFYLDTELTTELKTPPTLFPDNISLITWTLYVPTGVKAKLQASTFAPDKLSVEVTNLDRYWIDFDMNGEPAQDSNGFVTGPVTLQGAIPIVNGLRMVRETGSSIACELGIRGQ